MTRAFQGEFPPGTAKKMKTERWLEVLSVKEVPDSNEELIEFRPDTHQRFTTKPNSDVFKQEASFDADPMNLEIWKNDGRTVWVLTIRNDRGGLVAHTSIGDAMAARILRE